ncbi:hypothetical protein [Tenacibaculum amylolyticum]|uniref:hypothetical protein n=1 Tax=Tenacibaculum amylolyticum TaxID=104269 RepID=UPI0038936F4A
MIPLEADYSGIVILILAILFGPPLVLIFLGTLLRKKYKNASKIFYILAVVYLLVGAGLCFGGL